MENSDSEHRQTRPERSESVHPEQETIGRIADITLNHFKDYFDSRIGSLKRELKEDASYKSDRVVKQLKTEHSYKFKFEGNRVQHEFNAEVDNEVSRIKRAAASRDYSKIRDICYDIREKIHKRNKLIKMADKSPAGWDTVKEYLSDELASDSEDEKKIRAAENRALRAKKQKDQERIRRKYGSGYGNSASYKTVPADRNVHSTAATGNRSNFRSYQYDKSSGPKPTDICFSCNTPGHWRRNCPKLNKGTASGQ